MAQINVKDDLFFKAEWFNLLIKTGSADTAIGALVRVWRVAQTYWFPNKELIPYDVWKREQLNYEVINCGLAIEKEEGIYARGTIDCCEWMFVQLEKAKKAGLRSAQTRKKTKENFPTQVEEFANYSTQVKKTENFSTHVNLITSTSVIPISNLKKEEERRGEISPTSLIELFNQRFKGVGKIKQCPNFFLPASVLEDYKLITGYSEFQKIATWENYFDLVAESDFLKSKFTPSLAWILKPENAFKVLGGQYQNGIPIGPEKEDHKKMAFDIMEKYKNNIPEDEFTDREKMAIAKYSGGTGILYEEYRDEEFELTLLEKAFKNSQEKVK